MLFAVLFVCTRIAQIVTLIVTVGLSAWVVHQFDVRNLLTPEPILVLFITAVLALTWAIFTLFSYHRSSANARFVSLVDVAIFATLIAAVYLLRDVANADCTNALSRPGYLPVATNGEYPPDKPCAMMKACFAFAIMNIVFFFTTAIAAYYHGDNLFYDDRRSRRSSSRHRHGRRHSSHHHHHHRSSRSSSYDARTHSPRRSTSHTRVQRVYV